MNSRYSERKTAREILAVFERQKEQGEPSDFTFSSLLQAIIWDLENVKTETLETDVKELIEDFKDMREQVDYIHKNFRLQFRKWKSFERKFNKKMGIKK